MEKDVSNGNHLMCQKAQIIKEVKFWILVFCGALASGSVQVCWDAGTAARKGETEMLTSQKVNPDLRRPRATFT